MLGKLEVVWALIYLIYYFLIENYSGLSLARPANRWESYLIDSKKPDLSRAVRELVNGLVIDCAFVKGTRFGAADINIFITIKRI